MSELVPSMDEIGGGEETGCNEEDYQGRNTMHHEDQACMTLNTDNNGDDKSSDSDSILKGRKILLFRGIHDHVKPWRKIAMGVFALTSLSHVIVFATLRGPSGSFLLHSSRFH